MIAGPFVKAALKTALESAVTDFVFVDTDREWAPKLWMFLDASLVESSSSFESEDPCGTVEQTIRERSQIYLYAVSIAEDDAPTVAEVELEVQRFVSLVIQTIGADTTLGVSQPGIQYLRVTPATNETSTRQMQSAGGQMFNACRAFMQIEVEALFAPASLTTV